MGISKHFCRIIFKQIQIFQRRKDVSEFRPRSRMAETTEKAKEMEVESSTDKEMEEEEEDDVMKEVSKMSTDEVVARTRLLDNDIRIMKSEIVRISHEKQAQEDKIKENTENQGEQNPSLPCGQRDRDPRRRPRGPGCRGG